MATTISLNYGGAGFADYTAFLRHGSLTVKQNTADFAFHNLFPFWTNGALLNDVIITDPPWVGKVTATRQSTYSEADNTNYVIEMTATNSDPITVATSPFDLSYSPANTTTMFELEDGSGHIMLEAGTPWGTAVLLTEGNLSFAYSDFSFSWQTNTDASVSILGTCVIQQPGLWPGHTFLLTAPTPMHVSTFYTVTQVTVLWPALSTKPFFRIEFGASQVDTGWTLNRWKIH